jgi:hypothetical protein
MAQGLFPQQGAQNSRNARDHNWSMNPRFI